jgi:hypothetical protein
VATCTTSQNWRLMYWTIYLWEMLIQQPYDVDGPTIAISPTRRGVRSNEDGWLCNHLSPGMHSTYM